jgi:hypothetical protein
MLRPSSRTRLLSTYAALVGLPALALFALLRLGEVIAGPARSVAVVPTTAITQPTGAATPNVPLL